METVTLNPGDSITKGQKVAVLSDDTRLRLEQYYSYAYAGDLQVGQTVNVSIPALMTSVPGTVERSTWSAASRRRGPSSSPPTLSWRMREPDGGYGGLCHRHCER